MQYQKHILKQMCKVPHEKQLSFFFIGNVLVHYYTTQNHAFEKSCLGWTVINLVPYLGNADNKMHPVKNVKMFAFNGISVLKMKINVLYVNTRLIILQYILQRRIYIVHNY